MDAVVVLTQSIKEDAMSATSRKQNEKNNVTVKAPREGSVVWAAIQVLDGKRTPMHPDEITAEIQKRRLAKKLDGKTPNASVAARLAVHAAQGLYFERPEKGKYLLKKGVTAKSIASGNGSAAATSTRGKANDSKGRRKPASRGRRQSSEKPAQQEPQPAATAADDGAPAPAAQQAAVTA
jgi:hypothetical protein